MKKQFKVTLHKSMIGCRQDERDTVRCLGLRRRHHTVLVNDSPAARGQLVKVQHLVNIEVAR
ncbi:MAG: 50S ribosomal protein L30 [Pseudobdellovibrionaceae bacterium]|jgi:large subunit ribosomal protein L30